MLLREKHSISGRAAGTFGGLAAVMGIALTVVIFAATTPNGFEAESGAHAGCAAQTSDSAASGSLAIKFTACALGLDATGATIPDTNYTIPAGAVFMATTGSDTNSGTQAAPVKTLNRAVSLTPSGGTVVIRGGVYRDWYHSADGTTYTPFGQPITLQAYPHEQPWFDGTDVVTGWTSDGAGHWYKDWSTPSFCENKYYAYKYDGQPTSNAGPCSHYDMYGDSANPAAGDPQMVFIDGTYIHEVKTLAEATGSNFYYDWPNKRIYIATNPSGHTVELAARPTAMVMGGSGANNIKILGLGFKRYATNEYDNQTHAALTLYGTNILVENSVFTGMAGQGLYAGAPGTVIRHNVFAGNGFNGFGSNGSFSSDGGTDGLVIDSNMVSGNNAEKFGTGCSASCAQAGIKIAHMDGFTVKNNIFQNNTGWGLWCDLACTNGVMINNLITNNSLGGLLYEVSDTGIVASNLVTNNGGEGIRIASADSKVYNNTVVNNAGLANIWVYDDPRHLGTDGWTDIGPDTQNVQLVDNIISGAKPAVRLGDDYAPSPWPTHTVPGQYFSSCNYNAYFRSDGSGQTLVGWYDPTGPTYLTYTSLPSFTSATGCEASGIDISSGTDPFFVDQAGGNYSVRSTSTAYHSGTAIPADVVAALGLPAGTGYSRGAISWPGQ